MNTKKTLKGAVVGVGYLGHFHAQKVKALAAAHPVELFAVCDVNPEQLKKIATELSCQAVQSPQELVGKIDFAVIATQTPLHFEIAELFLKNGIHVNVEKPLCVDTKQAEHLVGLAQKNNLKLAVGHSERFSPGFAEIKKHLNKPSFIEFSRQAPFKARGSDVSVVFDLMVHDLDLMLNLDASEAELVQVSGGSVVTKTLDWARADFVFASGLKCSVSAGRVASQMTRIIRAYAGPQVFMANLQTSDFEVTSAGSDGSVDIQVSNLGKSDNLLKEDEDFIQSILNNKSPQISGQDGLKAVSWAQKITENIMKNHGK